MPLKRITLQAFASYLGFWGTRGNMQNLGSWQKVAVALFETSVAKYNSTFVCVDRAQPPEWPLFLTVQEKRIPCFAYIII